MTAADVAFATAVRLVDVVRAEAERRGLALSVAVVDRGGHPVATGRMDGAQLGSASLALDKAYTAVAFRHPTSAWTRGSAPGGDDWGLAGSLGGRAVVIPGGIPLHDGSGLVGGLGVSGTAAPVDEACALAAAAACGLTPDPAPATPYGGTA